MGYVECDEFEGTFGGATSFTGDLSNWDTSSVTIRSRCDLVHGRWIVKLGYVECDDFVLETFYGATSFTGDGLSNWDTSSVTSLYRTFYGATSFTGDGVSNWDTSSVVFLSLCSSLYVGIERSRK